MAPPIERWYLGEIRDEGDLLQSLRNLERIERRKDEILDRAPIPTIPPDPQAGDVVRYDGSQWVPYPLYDSVDLKSNDFTPDGVATQNVTVGAAKASEIRAPDSADSFWWASFILPSHYFGVNLTIEIVTRGAGTSGNFRFVYELSGGPVANTGNVTGFTGSVSGPFAANLHTLTTTEQIGSGVGNAAALLLGRDPDHADDNIADDVDFVTARIYPTSP